MKRNKFIFKRLYVILAAAIAVAALCIGCADDGRGKTVRLVSYTSTDSTVYSSTAEVVKLVADSVVEIKTESVTTQWGMQYIVSGAGSGVIVAHDEQFHNYYIITNNHVVEGAQNIQVTLRSGDSYKATLIASDVSGDIAVISISENCTLNVAVLGNSDTLQIGEDVIAIGNPLGSLGGTVTKGILSATERSIPVGNYTMTLLQTDTAINPGNSGGGLFNMRGELIGIVNAKTSDEEVEGICFAIPINTARAIFDDLVTNGVVTGRVTLGIEVAAGNNNIVYVTDAGASQDGTFKLYDRVYEINGSRITSLLSYHDVLAKLSPDDEVEVTVYRGSLQQTVFGTSLSFSSEPTKFKVQAKQLTK